MSSDKVTTASALDDEVMNGSEQVKPKVFDLSAISPERFEELAKRLLINPSEPIHEPEPLISTNGKTLFFRGGVYAIGGCAGTRKTTTLTLLTSILCGRDESENGITTPRPLRVLYLDTEQNRTDTQRISNRVERLCGIAARTQLAVYPLNQLTPDETKAFIELSLMAAQKQGKPFDAVVIDNWTDCMDAPNDPDQSIALTRQTRQLAEVYDIAVIGVCHTNEGGTTNKLRGHAGSELMRRADMVLLLSDMGEYSKVSYPKSRGRKPDPFCISHTDEGLPCFYTETASDLKPSNPDKYASIVAKMPRNGCSYTDLLTFIAESSTPHKPQSTAKRWLANMVKDKAVSKFGEWYYNPQSAPKQEDEPLPF